MFAHNPIPKANIPFQPPYKFQPEQSPSRLAQQAQQGFINHHPNVQTSIRDNANNLFKEAAMELSRAKAQFRAMESPGQMIRSPQTPTQHLTQPTYEQSKVSGQTGGSRFKPTTGNTYSPSSSSNGIPFLGQNINSTTPMNGQSKKLGQSYEINKETQSSVQSYTGRESDQQQRPRNIADKFQPQRNMPNQSKVDGVFHQHTNPQQNIVQNPATGQQRQNAPASKNLQGNSARTSPSKINQDSNRPLQNGKQAPVTVKQNTGNANYDSSRDSQPSSKILKSNLQSSQASEKRQDNQSESNSNRQPPAKQQVNVNQTAATSATNRVVEKKAMPVQKKLQSQLKEDPKARKQLNSEPVTQRHETEANVAQKSSREQQQTVNFRTVKQPETIRAEPVVTKVQSVATKVENVATKIQGLSFNQQISKPTYEIIDPPKRAEYPTNTQYQSQRIKIAAQVSSLAVDPAPMEKREPSPSQKQRDQSIKRYQNKKMQQLEQRLTLVTKSADNLKMQNSELRFQIKRLNEQLKKHDDLRERVHISENNFKEISEQYNKLRMVYEEAEIEIQKKRQMINDMDIEIRRLKSTLENNNSTEGFNVAIKNQMEENQRIKERFSEKDEEILVLRETLKSVRTDSDNYRNELEIERLKHMADLKNLQINFEIESQKTANQLDSNKKIINSLNEKMKFILQQDRKKDEFLVNYLQGKTSDPNDKELIVNFFNQFEEVPKLTISELLKQEYQVQEQMRREMDELRGMLLMRK